MSLTIALSPEEEIEFRRLAASAHLDPEAYALQMFRRMVRDRSILEALGAPESDSLPEDVRGRIQGLHDDIRALGLKDVPFYPDEVMTREWIYGDHP